MAGFGRRRFLTCFYCGQRTSTRFDGTQRSFECPHCDATNYLDQNGEITDPPVSKTCRESTPIRYAASRTSLLPSRSNPAMSSSTSAEDGSVFCKTCLQNQHLFTASLAQYLPDDPDAPDYAEREKKYYRFRKGLEQLYPQICAECEPKVRARLERAAYTAKTDMLRRMIDRTNANRNVKSKGWLDLVSLAGRWLWISAFLLQLCWHVRSLVELAAGYSVVEQQAPWIQRAFSAYDRAVGQLPTPQHLTSWALAARVCSLWWNPRFVQSIRGFTKHIRGLPTWYCYQFIAVLIQLAFSKLTIYESADLSQLNMLVGGHALALAFTLYMYMLGPGVIRTEVAPLFESTQSPTPLLPPREERGAGGSQNMSELLDDILHSPPSKRPTDTASPDVFAAPSASNSISYASTSFSQVGNSYARQSLPSQDGRGGSAFAFDSLSLSNQPAQPVQYEEEMDWAPTASPYRAFNTHGQRQTLKFGEAPTEPKKGPFWYRVPPAPITPAQRVFNPPNQPRMRRSPASTSSQPEIVFRGPRKTRDRLDDRRGDEEENGGDERHKVAFAEPSFFSQPERNDPRNSLTDMFGQNLRLSQEQQEERSRHSWLGSSLLGLVSGNKAKE